MLEIKHIATGSSGNCYRVSSSQSVLMIECGIRYREIQDGFDFKLSEVAGCIVSHGHGDHIKSARHILKSGVDVWVSETTKKEANLEGHRVKTFEPKKVFTVGSFLALPFPLEHDVENHGFLIQAASGEKLLYITDTYYCRFRFSGVHYFMIECNYADEILDENTDAGLISLTHRNRVKKSHFSLENVKKFFQANDLSQCREIHLIHGSKDNGDPDLFRAEIQKVTGKPVYISGVDI